MSRYDKIGVGDTHQQMIDALGKPDHYCPVYSSRHGNSFDQMAKSLSGTSEVYQVSGDAYGIEFPVTETVASTSSGDGKVSTEFGPVISKFHRPLSICDPADVPY